MIIKRIKLENIRSYEEDEILFPEGSVLFSGDIGSGKSTLLLAVEFALFGIQKGTSGSNLLRLGKNKGRIEIELNINGDNIIIERNLKRNKTIQQSSVSISINGKKEETSVMELKNKILQLLNYPPEFLTKSALLYRYTVYTPQEQMREILQEQAEIRLNTLRNIFGLNRYKNIKENTDLLLRKFREKMRENHGVADDLEKKKEEKKRHDRRKKEINSLLKIKDSELKKISMIVNSLNEKLSGMEKEQEKLSKLKEEHVRISSELKNKKEQANQLEKRIKGFVFAEGDINKEISFQNDAEQKLKTLSKKIMRQENIKEEMEKLKKDIIFMKTCPLCKQNVDEEHKKKVIADCEEKLSVLSIEKDRRTEEELEKQLLAVREKLEKLKESEMQKKIIAEQKTIFENLQKDILFLSKNSNLAEEKIKGFLVGDSGKIKKELEKENAEEKKKIAEKAELSKENNMLSDIISLLEEEIVKKEQAKSRIEFLKEMINWLSGNFLSLVGFTEQSILLNLRNEFCKLFERWFSFMVSETLDAEVDENFTPVIKQQGFQLDYNYLSGGERTAAALAYRLSLNQVINSLLSRIKTKDILILDEPTDGFSAEQINKLKDLLSELNAKQILIVSHEPAISNFVQNVIKLRKEGNTTLVG